MTWTAPAPERREPPTVEPDERRSLEAWLDYHRATLLVKCQGLTGEQLAQQSAPPSNLSLLGLVRHMADVERGWFCRRLAGRTDLPYQFSTDDNPDADFEALNPDAAEADYAALVAEQQAAREAAAGRSLDDRFTHKGTGTEFDLRWVYVHMIEEYARHNGHADLLREAIDGTTGD